LEDSKGIVWFSTPNGLGKLDPKIEKIEFFTEDDGLPTNLVGAIQEDNYGNLWISSAAGLTTLVRNETGEKETFINIDIKDGLQGYSFSLATWKANNGELFFGGDNGVNYFIPGKTNQTKPKIVLTDLKISDVSVFIDFTTSPLKKDLNGTEELILDYSQNDISLQFAPIHYSRPERNLIAYKLEGFNKDWVYSKLHLASFTNLDPGEYTFRLKAANGDGVWGENEKVIRIEILPPYWRTTFAYIGYGFLFVGFVFGVDRVQRRRLLTKTRNAAAIKEAELRAQLAEAENERKTQELEEARQLQLSMLPKVLPQLPHLDIAVYMKTATEVGGDYYDFNVSLDGTLTVVLGDATGHGMKAGTMVTSAKSLFNSYAANPDILFTFREMTRCIKQMQFQSLAMSMMMLKIKNNKLMMSSAGMPPVYLFRNKHKIIEEYLIEGMPLGTMDNFPYELKEMELFSGDTILLMSDGFPELNNQHNEMFGYRRARNTFEEVAEKEPEKIIDYLINEGSRWSNDKDPADDVTFVVIKFK
jgi:serine phosphatase RsbU (regulator of sigma subunit)